MPHSTPVDGFRLSYGPLFPRAWSARLAGFFTDADLRFLDGPGHFVPVEAPQAFAAAILERLPDRVSGSAPPALG